MISQSAATPEFSRPPLATQLNFEGDTCPSCGQHIPIEKLEEARGRIALRDHEQAVALTARLEQQYEVERTEARAQIGAARRIAEESEGRLKLEMQQLRQDGLAALESAKAEAKRREDEIRAETNKAAETMLAERLAALELSHTEAENALQTRIAEIESGKTAAEQQAAGLLQAIEDVRAEAKRREGEIRAEANKAAETMVTEQLAALELSHTESENALQTRIAEIESGKTTAEQQAAALSERVEALQNAKEAELVALSEQHAKALTEQLTSQREVLEKAKEEALNIEKANAFEETQKLANKVSELQRALEKKTNDELGEGAEVDLYEALKKEFPDDRITRIAKGEPGADIRHIVMLKGKECGTILYDSKNHKGFRTEHVTKLRTDQLAAKAEHAILSTHKFPQGTRQLHFQDGVLLANPARVVVLAAVLRQHLTHVHILRLSSIERERKTLALYDFITSDQCGQLLQRVEERCEELLNQQTAEMKWHQKHWQKQGEAVRAIQKAKANLENDISTILGTEQEV